MSTHVRNSADIRPPFDLDQLLQHANNQVTENKHAETIEMIENAQDGGGGLFGNLVGSVVQALAEPLEALGMNEQLAQMIASMAVSVALGAVSGGAGTAAVVAGQVSNALGRVAQGDLGGFTALAQVATGAAGINVPPEVLNALESLGRGELDAAGFVRSTSAFTDRYERTRANEYGDGLGD